MNKYSKILFSFIAVLIFTNNVYATTIKETTVTNDTYDTIERNTTNEILYQSNENSWIEREREKWTK